MSAPVLPLAVLREISLAAGMNHPIEHSLVQCMAEALIAALRVVPDLRGGDAAELADYVSEVLEERDRADEEVAALKKDRESYFRRMSKALETAETYSKHMSDTLETALVIVQEASDKS